MNRRLKFTRSFWVNMKVAIVHDWLLKMRGGEKVLEVLCELFPEATLFSLFAKKKNLSETLKAMKIETSRLRHVPFISKIYRWLLPLFPFAIESMDLSSYDLIISSSHCVAKGVKKRKGAVHICYCHTPMRYAWTFEDEYFGKMPVLLRDIVKFILSRLREWDLKNSREIDYFICNSETVRKRIMNIYGRDADIIYPPARADKFKIGTGTGRFYLMVGALVPYKKFDLAVEAFNRLGRTLVIVGDGPELKKCKAMARANVKFLGWVNDQELVRHYSNSKALIFPGEEDFGIVPVEAQLSGKPVIAYGKGGVLDSVIGRDEDGFYGNSTGIFFNEQTPEALVEAVKRFEKTEFNAGFIREHALKFSKEVCRRKLKTRIDEIVTSSKSKQVEEAVNV